MSEQMAQQVAAYIERSREEMLSYLAALVRAESPTGSPEDHDEVVQLLAVALKDMGYEVDRLPGPGFGDHIYAHLPSYQPGAPAQLLLGHYDTVWPKGTIQKMPVEIKDGKMTGPGVYDMKAGLVQAIYACKALQDIGQKPSLVPLFLFNSDEERGSRTSTPQIQALAQHVERVFVLEPSLEPGSRLKTARKGIGRFTIKVKGKASHAGLAPQEGQSAILELSFLIQKLFALNDFDRGITVNVGMIDGGVNPNVIAPESTAVVDVRVLTDQDATWVEQQIQALRPNNPAISIEVDGGMGRPPLEKTPRNRQLWQLARAQALTLGLALEEGTAGGGSDGNTTSQYTATLDGLGAVGDGAHSPHEFVEIEPWLKRCSLLALLLLQPSIDNG